MSGNSTTPLSARDKLEQSRRRWLAKQQAQNESNIQSHETIPSSSITTDPSQPEPTPSVPQSNDRQQPEANTATRPSSPEQPVSTSGGSDAPLSHFSSTAVDGQNQPRGRRRHRSRKNRNQLNTDQNSANDAETADQSPISTTEAVRSITTNPVRGQVNQADDQDSTPEYRPQIQSRYAQPSYRQRQQQNKQKTKREQGPGRERYTPYNLRSLNHRQDQIPDNSTHPPSSRNNNHFPALPSPSMLGQLSGIERELNIALRAWNQSSNDSFRNYATHDNAARAENYEWAFIDESDVSDFESLITDPVMTYPFELDDFQKRAIVNIEQGHSVFVAAHTSAGKTAVAEYAIALAASMEGKAYYTSPIKSLSNQKLRDFRGKFDDVGLVTGDVSINETAQCVIMTTEILRSMLYRGADAIRDVRVVIFDEVQFLNDEERGVVWEETIIMLPPHINIVMLSATVPNALEFSDWVGRTKERKVAVVTTDKRPVPLKHIFLTPSSSAEEPNKLQEFVLLEQGGQFQDANFRRARNALIGFRDGVKKKKKEEGESEKGERQSKKGSRRRGKGHAKGTYISPADKADDDEAQTSSSVDASREHSIQTAGTNSVTVQDHAKIDHDGDDYTDEVSDGDAVATSSAGMMNSEKPPSEQDDKKKVPTKGNKNKGRTAKSIAAGATKAAASTSGSGPNSNRLSAFFGLVRYLEAKDMFPSIVFCFSKMKCEQIVQSLGSIDLLPNARDKNYVTAFIDRAIGRLREEDRNLPQVVRTRMNLCRGITAHHAGLLPLVKEVTEILFSEGYVKVLFATETFAIGVNMPARSVVFSGLTKYDGRRRRMLESGEYTQMSGRAGRRGIDKVGNVFMFMAPDEKAPELNQLRRTMTAPPISLKSAFRLTYSMILNVLRVDELRVEEVMKQSFSEATIGTRSDNLSEVISRVGTALGKMNMGKDADDEDEDNASDDNVESEGLRNRNRNGSHPSNTKANALATGMTEKRVRRYVMLFAKLKVVTEEIPLKYLNGVIRKYLEPGRLAIAETAPGRLSLSCIFSLVPPRNTPPTAYIAMQKPGHREWINKYTTVWVATVTGVDKRRRRKHVDTTLLLQAHPFVDDMRPREMVEQGKRDLRVSTSSGLVVSLRSVSARNIVYFCDKVDEQMTEHRMRDQNASAFRWFRHNSEQGAKWMHVNADFLEGVLADWKNSVDEGGRRGRNSNANGNGLPVEVCKSTRSASGAGFRTVSGHGTGAGTSTGHEQGFFCDEYRERVELCERMIYDGDLGSGLNQAGGVRVMDGVGAAVMQERVRQQMRDLRKAQEGADVKEPSLLPEYNQRLSVLERLGYVEEGGLCVFLKGRCACEVATADSVVLTEIIMENVLNDLSIPEIASLLSALLCRKKNDASTKGDVCDEAFFGQRYCEAKGAMRAVVKLVGEVQTELGVTLEFELGDDSSDGYENAMCRWDLAKAVYAWADGESFADIAGMTSQQEGDIVVCVKRLCELLKDAQAVAKGVGNVELVEKLEGVVEAIKRDVIFNASLYYE